MATVVYRNGLNRKSFELEARKKNGEILLVMIDYINDFRQESIFTEHPVFSTKKEANEWVKEYSEESYKNDKEFCNSYIQ